MNKKYRVRLQKIIYKKKKISECKMSIDKKLVNQMQIFNNSKNRKKAL